jgi:hypothetical protein
VPMVSAPRRSGMSPTISINESLPRSLLRIPSASRAVCQCGIEQCRSLSIARAQVRVDADLLCQLSVRHPPICRRRREPIRKNVLTPPFEDSYESTAKECRVQDHELLHEDKIDQIFCATAPLTLAVSSGVRMDLLRNVLFEPQDRHFDLFDAREYQKIRSANRFRLPFEGV